MNHNTQAQRLSWVWIVFPVVMVGAAFIQLFMFERPGIAQSSAMALAWVIMGIGLFRTWQWSRDPKSQAPQLWTTETILLTAVLAYMLIEHHQLAAVVAGLALAFHLLARDYVSSLVHQFMTVETEQRQQAWLATIQSSQEQTQQIGQRAWSEIQSVLTDEPVKLTQTVQNAVQGWGERLDAAGAHLQQNLKETAEQMRRELLEAAQASSTALSESTRAVQEELRRGAAEAAMTLAQSLTASTDQLGKEMTSKTGEAAKAWLDGAQEAALSWRRASETGVRCLNDQMAVVTQKWEQQLEMSQGWMKEFQHLLAVLGQIANGLTDSASERMNSEARLAASSELLSKRMAEFQQQFERVVGQLLQEQKEWTLGLVNQKRHLQLDQ